jgi:ureidoglycolate hydrolase
MLLCACHISFFARGTIAEHIRFAVRAIAERTPLGTRHTVGMKDNPFLVHVCTHIHIIIHASSHQHPSIQLINQPNSMLCWRLLSIRVIHEWMVYVV